MKQVFCRQEPASHKNVNGASHNLQSARKAQKSGVSHCPNTVFFIYPKAPRQGSLILWFF